MILVCKKYLNVILTSLIIIIIILILCLQWQRLDKVPEEKREIRVLISLSGDHGYKQYYQDLIDKHNRIYPSTELVPLYVDSDSHGILKLLYSKQANQSYDIACLGVEQIASLIDMELIEPLDDYLLRDRGLLWMNEQQPMQLANSMQAGRLYSLPFFNHVPVIYINKDKISWNQPKITLAELFQIAENYQRREHSPGLIFPADAWLIRLLTVNDSQTIIAPKERGKTLNLITEDKLKLTKALVALLDQQAGVSEKGNDLEKRTAFLDGTIPILAASSFYQFGPDLATSFELGKVPLYLDSDTSFPMETVHLYMVKQTDSGSYQDNWMIIQQLNELSEQKRETIIDQACYSGVAVRQNSKIQRIMELALPKLWTKETAAEEMLTQLQLQIDEILAEEE